LNPLVIRLLLANLLHHSTGVSLLLLPLLLLLLLQCGIGPGRW
jgi:hypothetical protein